MRQRTEILPFRSLDLPPIPFKDWELLLDSYQEVQKIKETDSLKNVILDRITQITNPFFSKKNSENTCFASMEIQKSKKTFGEIQKKKVLFFFEKQKNNFFFFRFFMKYFLF